VRRLPPVTTLSHLCGPPILPGVEVFCPKTIIIKQYLSTNNISINNTHFVMGSKDVAEVLLEAGASLFIVDKQVINISVKRRQSNTKPF
jgi:hypothetical protein